MSLNRVITPGVSVASANDINGLQAAWDSYTPTLTNMTIGNGAVTGRYLRVGKTIFLRVSIAAGSATTYTASQVTVSLPFAAHPTSSQVLSLRLAASAGQFVGAADISIGISSTVMLLAVPASTARSDMVGLSSGSPNPTTVGSIVIEGVYEAA